MPYPSHGVLGTASIAHICWILLWAKIARQKHTIAPSYEQTTAKIGEIHGTVNLGFKRPVHEGYILDCVIREAISLQSTFPLSNSFFLRLASLSHSHQNSST